MSQELLIDKEITFIETNIPESLVLDMERIIDANGVSGAMPERSSAKWLLSVIDEEYHYHVTLQLSAQKIRGYECNCKAYLSGELCAHVAAALLYARRVSEEKAVVAKRPTGRTKSSLNAILKQLSRGELEQLVKDSAKRDSTFRLLVQGRYYTMLDIEEQRRVIEKSFPAITQVDQKIGQKYVSSFLVFCEEVLSIYSDLLIEENYVSAYETLFPILKKSFYIKTHIQKENTRLLKNHKLLLERFLEMTVLIEAPALRDSMNDELLELLSSSYISANTVEEQKIWLYIYLWPECRERLLSIVRASVAKGKETDVDSYYVFYMMTLLCDTTARESALSQVDSQTSYRVLQLLLTMKEIDGVKQLLSDFVMYTDINRVLLRQVLTEIASQEVSEKLSQRLLEIYMSGNDPYVLEWLHKHSGQMDRLTDHIKSMAENTGNVNTMIDYLLLTDRADEAVQIIAEEKSLPLLKRYDSRLLAKNSKQLLELYKDICDHYIQEHFGASSRDYLIDVYQHLKVIGADTILKKLQDHIKTEFKNRRSLKA